MGAVREEQDETSTAGGRPDPDPQPPRWTGPSGRAILRRTLWVIYLLLWAGGLAGFTLLPEPPEPAILAGPLFLAFTLTLIILSLEGRREAAWLACAGAIGFASEVVGTATGWPFSSYGYSDKLGPLVLDVPLAVIGAWVVLSWYARHILLPLRLSRVLWVAAGAAWVTAVDLLLDPLAAGPLGFWHWDSRGPYYGVPLQNYGGWLLVSAIIFLLGLALLPEHGAGGGTGEEPRSNATARRVGFSVLVFFTVIAVDQGMWLAAAIGAAMLGAHVVLARRYAGRWI